MFNICLKVLVGKLAGGYWRYIFNPDYTLQRSVIKFYFPFLISRLELKKFIKSIHLLSGGEII